VKKKKAILFLFLVGMSVVLVWQQAEGVFTLQALKSNYQSLLEFKESNFLLFAIAYFVIYVISTALSVPGAAILTVAGGALFGLVNGTILVSFASSIGALLAFFASRYLLRSFITNKFFDQYQKIKINFSANQSTYLLSLRLAPVFPFFLINIIMGLLPIGWRRFYFVSQIGMLPGTIVYVNAGVKLSGLESVDQIMTPSIIISLLLVAFFPYIMGKIFRS
jgi:uncharacterized membrane protein YdjX (TVP38/TMEM64 family)